jgi:nicotinamidase/pyrazinamidase
MRIETTDALIVVDVQNDFCPDGALQVADGDLVIPPINDLIARFRHVVLSRDWHPANHCSFAESPQFMDRSWPVHCVANSPGAQFHRDLHMPANALIISKGTHADCEAYSAFSETGLAEHLRERGVTRLFVCGLATDYCVKETVLDGLRNGFVMFMIEDACRGVDIPAGSAALAVDDMKAAGAGVCQSGDFA